MRVEYDPREDNKSGNQVFEEMSQESDFLRSMRSGVHCKFIIEHDGRELPMRLISEEEQNECLYKAAKDFDELPKYCQKFTFLIERFRMIYMLERSLSSSPLNPTDGSIFLPIEALKNMTTASLSTLFAKYVAMDKHFSPNIDDMTDNEFQFLLDECVKKPELVSNLSVLQLQRIAHIYIQQFISQLDK